MKTDLYQSYDHCWVFQIFWHIECSTFKTSSFRIWNSSTGIPSPPIALFIVMLPKALLTSHSRMSGSRWVITPFCVFLSPLHNIFCFCEAHNILSFIVPTFAWNVPFVSLIFLKISLVFPILLISSIFCVGSWGRFLYLSLLFFGTLHSNEYIFSFLLCFSLLFFPQLFVRPP